MDEQRELLDQLMGVNRNNDRSHNEVTDYRDERVCKLFLRGLCPHDMFVNTKNDEGPCKKLHSLPVKMRFDESDDVYIYDMMIEKELRARVADIDRTVRRQYDRLESEKDQGLVYERNEDYMRLTVDVVRMGDVAEAAADNDDIDKAQELMFRVDALMKQREDVKAGLLETHKLAHKLPQADPSKKLRVCDVCGSLLSILDSDKRLADHFMGKQHIGFQTMRDALVAIDERRKAGVYDRVNFSGVGGNGGGARRSRSPSGERGGGRRDRSRDRRQRSSSRNRQRSNQKRDSRDRGSNRGSGGGGGSRNIYGGGYADTYGGGGGGRNRGRW